MTLCNLSSINISHEERQALIERLQSDESLTITDRELCIKLIQNAAQLLSVIQEKNISIHRLQKMIFGQGARHTKNNTATEPGESTETAPPGDTTTENNESHREKTKREPPALVKGHGRIAGAEYHVSQVITCKHTEYSVGECCPECQRGTLYRFPSSKIQLDGQAPITAIRYDIEGLRCSACQEVFQTLPEILSQGKYTYRARATVTVVHYGVALPFHRLEKLQACVGVPVPDATQWELVEKVDDCSAPVFNYLFGEAAIRALIYQDDTTVKILSLMAENKELGDKDRRGMYTTGIVAAGEHPIVLYFSGRQHAGENVDDLLALRGSEQGPILKMSDAINANKPKQQKNYIDCNCNAHVVRKFDDIKDFFPEPCSYVLQVFSQIYKNDAACKQQNLDAQQRLVYHQQHSGPLLASLKNWLAEQFEKRLVEPNSSLGKAYSYIQNHWQGLTRFLEIPGVPLDNNTVERALKQFIQLRKSSLFFSTEHGAQVGSRLCSLIATCYHSNINPIEYLTALQTHRRQVSAAPHEWLPWNYLNTLEQLTPMAA